MTLSNKKITSSIYDSNGNINGCVSKMDKSYTQTYYKNNHSYTNSSITYIQPNNNSNSTFKSIKSSF